MHLLHTLIMSSQTERKGDDMATKSILKNIDIKDKKLGKSLVIALENAAGKHAKDVQLTRTYEDVRGDKLRSIINNERL